MRPCCFALQVSGGDFSASIPSVGASADVPSVDADVSIPSASLEIPGEFFFVVVEFLHGMRVRGDDAYDDTPTTGGAGLDASGVSGRFANP